ncbi:MAG: hypothetical protein GQ574_18875 [Crocinitomix sp.]|nr:hypothetical protein [Crocinitomix sp.]
MQNNDTRGSLGSKFESFGAAPSEGLWGSIASSLDGKKKRKAVIWWWLGAAAVTLAAVGIVLTNTSNQEFIADHEMSIPSKNKHLIPIDPNIALNSNDTIDNSDRWLPNPTENDESISEKKRNNLTVQELEASASNNAAAINALNESNNAELNEDVASQGEDTDLLKDGSEDANQEKQDALVEKDELNNNKEDDNTNERDRNDPIYEEDEDAINPDVLIIANRLDQLPARKIDFTYGANMLAPITALKPIRHRWELGFMVNRFNSFQGKSQYQLVDPMADTTVNTIAENDLLESINNNYTVKVTRPIGLQFHVAYQLSQRFRIVSGISAEYTSYRYKAESEWGDVNSFTPPTTIAVIPARLTSIGIPIGLEFDFIKRRRFKMGTGVSLLNEFPILETYRPDYDLNYVGTQSNNRSFISGYNMGLNFNLNASVYLTDKMRIQASPTFRYYATQNSSSALYLPKRDFWLGGSVGLIWELRK